MSEYAVQAKISAVDENFTATLSRATQAAQGFGTRVNQHLSSIGKGMMAAGAATTAMGVTGVKSFGQFQQSLNTAAVVAGGTSKDISGLSDVANKMGADLPLSAQQCSDAMIEMARNGASVGDIKEQFPAISQAATAAGADLTATAGTVQQAMNIWGDSLKSPQQAASILVQTANASNASIEDMGQALATIGGSAKQAGMSMGTTSEAIGLLTNRGFSAAQASLDLNHAILQMLAPSKVAQKTMDALGITFVDNHGKMKPFKQILLEVANATDKMGDAQKTAALKAMFGTAGMQAILPLLDSVKNKSGDAKVSWDAYAKEQAKVSSSTEAAKKSLSSQASEMQKNVGAKIEQVGGNWESLRNKSLASKEGISSDLLDLTNNTLNWAQDSDSALAKVIRSYIGLSPVIGPAMTAVGGFLTNFGKIAGVVGSGVTAMTNFGKTISTVTGALKAGKSFSDAANALTDLASNSKIAKTAQVALNGAIKIGQGITSGFGSVISFLAANPMVAVGLAIAAVVAALVLFFTKTKLGQQIWANFTKFLQNCWNGLKSAASSIWSGITSTISNAANGIHQGWDGLTNWFGQLWNGIKSGAQDAWNGFSAFMSPVVEGFKNVWNGLSSFFGNLWNTIIASAQSIWQSFITGMQPIIDAVKNLWNALGEFFSTLWQGIITAAQTIWQGIVTVFTPIIQAIKVVWQGLTTFFSTLWQGIVTVAQTIWQGLVTGLQGIWTAISTAAQVAWQGISVVLQTAWQQITIVAQTIWQTLVTIVQTVWTNIQIVIQTAIQIIQTVIQTAMTVIQTIWSTAWNVISTVVSTIWQAISTVISTAINAIAGIIKAVTYAIQGNWSAAWNAIKGVAQTIWNGIKSLASTVFNGIKKVITTVVNGISSVWRSVWNGIKSVTSTIFNGIKNIISTTMNAIRSIANSMMNGVRSVFQTGWEGVKSVFNWGADIIKSIMRGVDLFSIGSNIIQGLINGINSMLGWLSNTISNVASTVTNGLGHLLRIHSPSKVMRDKIGRWIPAGIAVGMRQNLGTIKDANQDLYNASLFKAPEPNFNRWNNGIQQLNTQARQTLNGSYEQELTVSQQPAYINLNLGGTEFSTFVDDISREQGRDAQFKRNYKF